MAMRTPASNGAAGRRAETFFSPSASRPRAPQPASLFSATGLAHGVGQALGYLNVVGNTKTGVTSLVFSEAPKPLVTAFEALEQIICCGQVTAEGSAMLNAALEGLLAKTDAAAAALNDEDMRLLRNVYDSVGSVLNEFLEAEDVVEASFFRIETGETIPFWMQELPRALDDIETIMRRHTGAVPYLVDVVGQVRGQMVASHPKILDESIATVAKLRSAPAVEHLAEFKSTIRRIRGNLKQVFSHDHLSRSERTHVLHIQQAFFIFDTFDDDDVLAMRSHTLNLLERIQILLERVRDEQLSVIEQFQAALGTSTAGLLHTTRHQCPRSLSLCLDKVIQSLLNSRLLLEDVEIMLRYVEETLSLRDDAWTFPLSTADRSRLESSKDFFRSLLPGASRASSFDEEPRHLEEEEFDAEDASSGTATSSSRRRDEEGKSSSAGSVSDEDEDSDDEDAHSDASSAVRGIAAAFLPREGQATFFDEAEVNLYEGIPSRSVHLRRRIDFSGESTVYERLRKVGIELERVKDHQAGAAESLGELLSQTLRKQTQPRRPEVKRLNRLLEQFENGIAASGDDFRRLLPFTRSPVRVVDIVHVLDISDTFLIQDLDVYREIADSVNAVTAWVLQQDDIVQLPDSLMEHVSVIRRGLNHFRPTGVIEHTRDHLLVMVDDVTNHMLGTPSEVFVNCGRAIKEWLRFPSPDHTEKLHLTLRSFRGLDPTKFPEFCHRSGPHAELVALMDDLHTFRETVQTQQELADTHVESHEVGAVADPQESALASLSTNYIAIATRLKRLGLSIDRTARHHTGVIPEALTRLIKRVQRATPFLTKPEADHSDLVGPLEVLTPPRAAALIRVVVVDQVTPDEADESRDFDALQRVISFFIQLIESTDDDSSLSWIRFHLNNLVTTCFKQIEAQLDNPDTPESIHDLHGVFRSLLGDIESIPDQPPATQGRAILDTFMRLRTLINTHHVQLTANRVFSLPGLSVDPSDVEVSKLEQWVSVLSNGSIAEAQLAGRRLRRWYRLKRVELKGALFGQAILTVEQAQNLADFNRLVPGLIDKLVGPTSVSPRARSPVFGVGAAESRSSDLSLSHVREEAQELLVTLRRIKASKEPAYVEMAESVSDGAYDYLDEEARADVRFVTDADISAAAETAALSGAYYLVTHLVGAPPNPGELHDKFVRDHRGLQNPEEIEEAYQVFIGSDDFRYATKYSLAATLSDAGETPEEREEEVTARLYEYIDTLDLNWAYRASIKIFLPIVTSFLRFALPRGLTAVVGLFRNFIEGTSEQIGAFTGAGNGGNHQQQGGGLSLLRSINSLLIAYFDAAKKASEEAGGADISFFMDKEMRRLEEEEGISRETIYGTITDVMVNAMVPQMDVYERGVDHLKAWSTWADEPNITLANRVWRYTVSGCIQTCIGIPNAIVVRPCQWLGNWATKSVASWSLRGTIREGFSSLERALERIDIVSSVESLIADGLESLNSTSRSSGGSKVNREPAKTALRHPQSQQLIAALVANGAQVTPLNAHMDRHQLAKAVHVVEEGQRSSTSSFSAEAGRVVLTYALTEGLASIGDPGAAEKRIVQPLLRALDKALKTADEAFVYDVVAPEVMMKGTESPHGRLEGALATTARGLLERAASDAIRGMGKRERRRLNEVIDLTKDRYGIDSPQSVTKRAKQFVDRLPRLDPQDQLRVIYRVEELWARYSQDFGTVVKRFVSDGDVGDSYKRQMLRATHPLRGQVKDFSSHLREARTSQQAVVLHPRFQAYIAELDTMLDHVQEQYFAIKDGIERAEDVSDRIAAIIDTDEEGNLRAVNALIQRIKATKGLNEEHKDLVRRMIRSEELLEKTLTISLPAASAALFFRVRAEEELQSILDAEYHEIVSDPLLVSSAVQKLREAATGHAPMVLTNTVYRLAEDVGRAESIEGFEAAKGLLVEKLRVLPRDAAAHLQSAAEVQDDEDNYQLSAKHHHLETNALYEEYHRRSDTYVIDSEHLMGILGRVEAAATAIDPPTFLDLDISVPTTAIDWLEKWALSQTQDSLRQATLLATSLPFITSTLFRVINELLKKA